MARFSVHAEPVESYLRRSGPSRLSEIARAVGVKNMQALRGLKSLKAVNVRGRWVLPTRGSVSEAFYTLEAQARAQTVSYLRPHSAAVFAFAKGFLKGADLPEDVEASEFDWAAYRIEETLRELQRRLVRRYRRKLKDQGLKSQEVEVQAQEFEDALRRQPARAAVSILPQFVAERWDQVDRRLDRLDYDAKVRAVRLARRIADRTYSPEARTKAGRQLANLLNIPPDDDEKLEYATRRLVGTS